MQEKVIQITKEIQDAVQAGLITRDGQCGIRKSEFGMEEADNLQDIIERAVNLERERIFEALKHRAVKMSEVKGNPWDPSSHKYYKAVSLKAAEEVIYEPFVMEHLLDEALRDDYEQMKLELD